MFTGIVEELGSVESLSGDGLRLRVGAHRIVEDIALGASIAVNGCCLTAVAWGADWWEADLSAETLARTNLGGLAVGDPVNLERPVRLADRLGRRPVKGSFKRSGSAGSNRFHFSGRLRGKVLRPGRYRLAATAGRSVRRAAPTPG